MLQKNNGMPFSFTHYSGVSGTKLEKGQVVMCHAFVYFFSSIQLKVKFKSPIILRSNFNDLKISANYCIHVLCDIKPINLAQICNLQLLTKKS